MELWLEILYEQVKNLENKFDSLVGQCSNIYEFSNYTITTLKKRSKNSKIVKLNNKIKELYSCILEIRENILNEI